MGLEFTNIPDHQGPAVYVLGGTMVEDRLRPWCDQLNAATPAGTQVVYVDFNTGDGAQIAEFYGITPENLPSIMIVMDDDTMYKNWSGMSLPSVETVAYELGQITGNGQA